MTYSKVLRRKVVELIFDNKYSARALARQYKTEHGCIGPTRRTIDNWVLEYARTGGFDTPGGGRRTRPGKMEVDHLHELLMHLHQVDPTLFLDEMVIWLKDKFGVEYKRTTVCVTLIRMGLSRRVLSRVNSNRCYYQRYLFLQSLSTETVEMFIFIDETRKDPKTLARRYGRQFRGSRIQVEVNWSRSARGYSALGVMTLEGMIDCAINNVNGVNRELFLLDLEHHVIPHMNAYPGKNSILILDNASIHHSNEVIELVEAFN